MISAAEQKTSFLQHKYWHQLLSFSTFKTPRCIIILILFFFYLRLLKSFSCQFISNELIFLTPIFPNKSLLFAGLLVSIYLKQPNLLRCFSLLFPLFFFFLLNKNEIVFAKCILFALQKKHSNPSGSFTVFYLIDRSMNFLYFLHSLVLWTKSHHGWKCRLLSITPPRPPPRQHFLFMAVESKQPKMRDIRSIHLKNVAKHLLYKSISYKNLWIWWLEILDSFAIESLWVGHWTAVNRLWKRITKKKKDFCQPHFFFSTTMNTNYYNHFSSLSGSLFFSFFRFFCF